MEMKRGRTDRRERAKTCAGRARWTDDVNTHLPGRCANLVMRRGDASLVRVAADVTVDGLFMSRCPTEKIICHTRDDELKLVNAAPVSNTQNLGRLRCRGQQRAGFWHELAPGRGTSRRARVMRASIGVRGL